MSSEVRAKLTPHFRCLSHRDRVTPAIVRTVAASALLLVGFAGVGFAQALPAAEPSYSVRCNDCFSTTSFHAVSPTVSHKTAAQSGGCQDYPQFNLYENWNPGEDNKPDQVNIRFARWASDADFWYFQIETAETVWTAPFYPSTHIEVAFNCSASGRFSLLITYFVNADQTDTSPLATGWDDLSTATMVFWRDGTSGGDVGDDLNDGPAIPAANTTEYPCSPPDCDGYETLFVGPPTNSAYTRLRTVGSQAMVEIAVRRSAFATFLGLLTFTPCDARFWQMQTSTLNGPDHFAWNDRLEDINLDSSSWAMDNCGTTSSVPVELMGFSVD